MKQIKTLSTLILTLLFIGTGNAYCDDTSMYFSTEGGTYKLLENFSDYHSCNLVLIASHVTINEADNVQIMTTETSSQYFGYYTTSISYNNDMPKYITVATVNKEIENQTDLYYPYEYRLFKRETPENNDYVYVSLKDCNNNFISYTDNTANSLNLNTKSKKWTMTSALRLFSTENYNNPISLLSENKTNNHEFTNSGNCTPVSIYKKVYPVTISSVEYATLYYGTHDLIVPSGITAYTYNLDGNKLIASNTYTEGQTIPAGTAVVLHGTPGTYYFDIIANTSIKPTNNLLGGTDTQATTTPVTSEPCRYFYLTQGSTGFGFRYKTENGGEFTNVAHKAYLCIPESYFTGSSGSAKSIEFLLPTDDDPTAIQSAVAEQNTATSSTSCYDLSGKRIAEPQHGTYIKGGKVHLK